MKDAFFEEYELKIYARVAIPRVRESKELVNELFKLAEDALKSKEGVLVAVTATTLIPLDEGKTNERSKTSF